MSETIIQELLAALTLEEKATLCTGKDFWHLHGVERLGLPSIMVTDGPHGMRKQAGKSDHAGLNNSVKATCFPTASGLAASWNPALIEQMGVALGKECRAENVSVLLGPGTNLKRNPLGGRNFEYFSEDPLLGADFSTAWINGVQSQNVGTSLKHYAVNNHEYCRMTVDVIIDQRTLRELYLPAFEYTVKQTQPWTIMNSYNKVNGVYLSEHTQLLNDILYGEWGYTGMVVTDWGANNDRVAGVKAGQALEMPSSGELNTKKIIAAVESGELSVAELDKSVAHVLELIVKSKAALQSDAVTADLDAHHQLAARIAEETAVLLKNDNNLLPVTAGKNIAVIGALAENTRYQGAGSSKINPFKLEQPLAEIQKRFGSDKVTYAAGYSLYDEKDDAAVAQAVNIAGQADVVFFFAGLTPKYESEGFDRTHLSLPQVQLDLLAALGKQQSKTVVILQNGAPVLMPFAEKVPAILEAYLGGQAGASAIARILSGEVNPSGKLAETFPAALDDVPSQPFFPGSKRQSQYREGIWVGYRYFDTADIPVLFPFGHGLSYTSFKYSDLKVSGPELFTEHDTVEIELTVTNTGERAGAEVIQIYVGQAQPSQPRPDKELKAHAKVLLQPGESKQVSIKLDYRAFAFWSVETNSWQVESDSFNIYAGASVADIRATASIMLSTDVIRKEPDAALKSYFNPAKRDFNDSAFTALLGYEIPEETPALPFTPTSTLADIKHTEAGMPVYNSLLSIFTQMMSSGDTTSATAQADKLMAEAIVNDMPLRNLPIFSGSKFSEQNLIDLLETLNTYSA